MKFKRRLTSGDLLLLELVFAIIFFCLTMSASMAVFGNAYEMSSKAEKLDAAVREANSAAEIIRSANTADDIYSMLQTEGFTGSGGVYSKEYGDGKYSINIIGVQNVNLFSADIVCKDTKGTTEPIYEINIKHALSVQNPKAAK